MIYYISDLHFGHKRILEYEPDRPGHDLESMENELVRKWNDKVMPDDTVYVLGDFSFYGKTNPRNLSLLLRLKGAKTIVRGNHDSWCRSLPQTSPLLGVASFTDYLEIKDNGRDVILFHYPILAWDRAEYGSFHLYGHTHGQMPTAIKYKKGLAINVGCMRWNYEPISLDEMLASRAVKDLHWTSPQKTDGVLYSN